MPLPDLTGIQDAAAQVITQAGVVSRGNTLKVYPTEPVAFESWPAAAIRLDGFQRRGLDDADAELGVQMWDLAYEVVVEVLMPDVDQGQRDMHAVVAQVVDAFDDNPVLGRADVDDAVLESGEQVFVTGETGGPQRVRFECVLAVRARST